MAPLIVPFRIRTTIDLVDLGSFWGCTLGRVGECMNLSRSTWIVGVRILHYDDLRPPFDTANPPCVSRPMIPLFDYLLEERMKLYIEQLLEFQILDCSIVVL
jgi:hypothetical protein